jgi:integrase
MLETWVAAWEDVMAPRMVGRLTSRRVNTAKPKAGRQALLVGDGGGLWLQITRGEGDHFRRSWTFRFELNGRRREMGLGALHTFSLAEARIRARELRQLLADGVDPLEAREAARRAKLAEAARSVTFEQAAEQYIRLHAGGWGVDHHHQWRASLGAYVFPIIAKLSVADIDQATVMRIVEPIWNAKPTTASRVLNRIERILDFAAAHEYRSNDNPAARVLSALPKKSRIAKVEHFAALPWEEMPAFVQQLRGLKTTAARCLEFLIYASARSDEAIGALWAEIDFTAKAWTIAGQRMKGGEEHRVPLSRAALELLTNMPRSGPHVFGDADGKMLQDHALRRQVLAKLRPGTSKLTSSVTAHGFRGSFKTWAGESTNFANETIELALAHKVGNKVEQAYEKGDKFEKRARLMQAWADYLAKPMVGGIVTPIRQRAGA